MTKVEISFRLRAPLDDTMMDRITRAHSTYGFNRIRVSPDLTALHVDYDATRLTPLDVEAAMARAGIPADRIDE
ncbi:MAG: hypothetical protein IPM24_05665 [Bryobacterales bacterium]|nr:hypothetical protein [Bryobacterales bacterium]